MRGRAWGHAPAMLGAGDAAGVGLEQPQELAWQDEEGALQRTMPLLSPPAPSPFLSCHLPSFWRQQAKLEPSPQIQASQGSPAPHSYSFGAGPLSALPSLPAASPRGQGDAGRLCWAHPPTTVPAASPHHPHRGLPSTLAFWERGESQHPTGAEGRGGWSPLWGLTGQAERRYLGPGRGQVPSPRGASSHAWGSVLGPGAAGALCQPGQPWCAKCQRQGQTALPPQHPLGCLCLALQASPLRCCKAFAECLALPKLRWQLTGAGMCLAGLCPMPGHRAQALGHAPMWKQSGGDPAACSSRGDAWSGLQSPPAQCCGSLYGPPGEADHQRCSEQKAVLRRHQPWAAPGRCVGLRGCLPSPFLHRRAGAWGLRSQPQLPLWSQ